LFKEAFNLNKKQDGILLFEKIKLVDLTKDKINVYAMRRLARKHNISLEIYMNKNCDQINIDTSFGVINITRALGGRMEAKPQWYMDNEYRRICLAWDQEHDAILENFERQTKSNGCLW
jgi:hypothetical protein